MFKKLVNFCRWILLYFQLTPRERALYRSLAEYAHRCRQEAKP